MHYDISTDVDKEYMKKSRRISGQ